MKIVTEKHKQVEEEVRRLKSQLEDFKRTVSELRKSAGYTKFAETLLQEAWPKIRLYHATLEPIDFKKVEQIFGQISEEIESIKKKNDTAYDTELNKKEI